MKIIVLDIETSPNIVYTWGKYEQNAIRRIKPWEILSFAWKELGKGRVQCIARPDFRDRSEKAITRATWKILNGADAVITQNGDRFDIPKLRAKYVAQGLAPLKPFKQIDTKKIAKSVFQFYSNSLDDMSEELGLGNKLDHEGFKLWERCMQGFVTPGKVDHAAWDDMRRYNKHDVVLDERLYFKTRAWYPTHPNFALLDGGENGECPVCGSDHVQKRGRQVLKLRTAIRLQCQNPKCGHWFHRSAA